MLSFDFCSPTRFIFGEGVEARVGDIARGLGLDRLLIQYGGGSVLRSGLLDRVKASLDAAGIAYVEIGGVVPNPRLSLVRQAIALGQAEAVDGVLAVGGGSVIDSCKATAVGLANPDKDVWGFYNGTHASPANVLPVLVVPTIPAAGSEGSASSVITNEENGMKRGLGSDATRPRAAFINPTLCATLPREQIANGAADIFAHIMERYFTNTPEVDITDRLCEAAMGSILRNASLVYENPADAAAWAEVFWTSTIAHNNSLGVGRDQDWACHQIEHELSGRYDVAHGAGLAAIIPSWMRYVLKQDMTRFVRFAVNVMHAEMDFFHPERTALEGIARLEQWFASLDLATTLGGLNIDDTYLTEMAQKVKKTNGDGTLGRFVILRPDDVEAILRNAL